MEDIENTKLYLLHIENQEDGPVQPCPPHFPQGIVVVAIVGRTDGARVGNTVGDLDGLYFIITS